MDTQNIILAMQRSSLCTVAEDNIRKRLRALEDIGAILRSNLTPENKVNAINEALSANAPAHLPPASGGKVPPVVGKSDSKGNEHE